VSVPTSRWLTIEVRVAVQELDGVLHRDDVERPPLVHLPHHRAASVVDLPLPVTPVTSTSPRGKVGDAVQHRRQVQRVQRRDLEGDGAEGHPQRAALVEDVGAEAAQPLHPDREVDLLALGELLALPGAQELLHAALEVLRAQRREPVSAARR
jgi:hypothetical protein